MSEIPSGFYTAIGVLIVANVGSIISMVFVGFRATWWLSKLDSRIDKAQDTANRAHQRIDKMEEIDA